MSLARRVRAGIALHAGVNVAFALGAVLSAAGGTSAVASDQPLPPYTSDPPSGLPIHSVTTIGVHPLLAAGQAPPETTPTTGPPAGAETGDDDATDADADADESGDEVEAPATTTTTERRTRSTQNASRTGLPIGTTRQVSSTGYCLTGITASGVRVGHGQAAMNGVPLGTVWRVIGGPRDGEVFEVTDRIGHGTDFDIWFPSCDAAIQYGRRAVTVELIG